MANKPIPWSNDEIELLKEKYPTLNKNELGKLFLNRSIKSITGKAEKLGLQKIGDLSVSKWTDEETNIVKEFYTDSSKEQMLKLLPNRTWGQIQHKSSRLNVRKYKEFREDRHIWTEEEIEQMCIDRGYKYYGTYFDEFNKRKIIIECEKGIESHVYFNTFKNGSEAGSRNITRKKTFSEIKEMIESYNYAIITKEENYNNTKSELILTCPFDHEWKTNAHNFTQGNRCNTCFLETVGKDNLLELNYVKEKFDEKGFIILDGQEYLGGDSNLDCKCKFHLDDQFILNHSYNQVVNRSIKCVHCVNDNKLENYKLKYNEISEAFLNKGLNLKTTIDDYLNMRINIKNEYIFFECNKHIQFGEQKIKIRSLDRSVDHEVSNCRYCAKEYISGENHYRWSGGVSKLNEFLRGKIQIWKFDSMKKYDFKCLLTGKTDNLVVHHKYPFSKITKETVNELKYDFKDHISAYSEEELNNIVELCLKKHYEYGYGICLHTSIHDLFHDEYSVHNFTSEDFDEFIHRYKNGEFNSLLKEVV